MYTCARSINFVSVSMIFLLDFGAVPTVLYFTIGFWNCSNSVVFFYWILELFQQCGIFLLDFGTVPTVLYFSIGFWNCSNIVFQVFLCTHDIPFGITVPKVDQYLLHQLTAKNI